MSAPLRLAYQLDRTAVTPAEADWLTGLPKASLREQDKTLRRLRSSAASTDGDRGRLHLIGMGLAVLGKPDEAVSVFIRASELDPATRIDAVNAAVALAHLGDLERARLWLSPVAQSDEELSGVARQFIEQIDQAQEGQPPPEADPQVGRAETGALLEAVTEGGPAGQAALNSLRQLVQRHPHNEHYRHALMFGLMANSDFAEALTQAEFLANRPNPTHERHFNVAQAFWFANDRERAHEHFELAHQLAQTDQERQDVVSMLEQLLEQDEQVDED
jgi:tetratricopeptide (TPR) repeat protein